MAPIGQIYGYANHPKVNRVLAAAAYNGVELEIVETQAMRGDTKKPEYTAIFPYGKIPGFKGTDGFKLTEGKAIARYGTLSLFCTLLSCLAAPSYPALVSAFTSLPRSSSAPASTMMRFIFTVIPVRIIHVEDIFFSKMP